MSYPMKVPVRRGSRIARGYQPVLRPKPPDVLRRAVRLRPPSLPSYSSAARIIPLPNFLPYIAVQAGVAGIGGMTAAHLLRTYLPKPRHWQLTPWQASIPAGWVHPSNYSLDWTWSCRSGGNNYFSKIHSAAPGSCGANNVTVTIAAWNSNVGLVNANSYIVNRANVPHPNFGASFVRVNWAQPWVRDSGPQNQEPEWQDAQPAERAKVTPPIYAPKVWQDPFSRPINRPVIEPVPRPGRIVPNPWRDPWEQPSTGPKPVSIQHGTRLFPPKNKAWRFTASETKSTVSMAPPPKKPPKKTRERKFKGIPGFVRHVLTAWNGVTEFGDVVGAMYKALPESVRKSEKARNIRDQSIAVWQHFDKIDMEDALVGIIYNEIENKLIGKSLGTNRLATQAQLRQIGYYYDANDALKTDWEDEYEPWHE